MLKEAMAEAKLMTTLSEAKNRFEVLAKSKGTHQEMVTVHGKTKTYQALRNVGEKDKEKNTQQSTNPTDKKTEILNKIKSVAEKAASKTGMDAQNIIGIATKMQSSGMHPNRVAAQKLFGQKYDFSDIDFGIVELSKEDKAKYDSLKIALGKIETMREKLKKIGKR